MSEKIKAYLMRAGLAGQLYHGYIAEVENSPAFEQRYVGDRIEVYSLTNDISIIGEDEAVIMGRTLNRAVYDESGKFVTVLAGNLMAVRYKDDAFGSICEEDIAVIEKLLKPIERIFDGEIFLKKPQELKLWEEKENESVDG